MLEKNIFRQLPGKYTFWKHKKFLKFGIVGGVGTIVNTFILWTLTSFAGLYYLAASVVATETAIVSNFVGNNIFTFRDSKNPSPLFSKFAKFQFISLTTIIGTVAILWILTTFFGINYLLIWNLIAILTMFVANFSLNKKFTWNDKNSKKDKKMNSSKKSMLLALTLLLLVFYSGFILAAENQTSYNATLSVNSTPEGASVLINESAYGLTPLNNLSLEPGNYSVFLSLDGYENQTAIIELPENSSKELNFELNETSNITTNETSNETMNETINETFSDNSTIVNGSTSLAEDNGSYFMLETGSANFSVTLDGEGVVEWYVEDVLMKTTANLHTSNFQWNPGILASSDNVEEKTVIARTNESEIQWKVNLQDVVNPFFNPPSGSETIIYVYTKDYFYGDEIKNVTVLVRSGVEKEFLLNPEFFDNETKWSFSIPSSELSYGNNYLTMVSLHFNESSVSYEIPTEGEKIRAFYKDAPQPTEGQNSGSDSSGSSGGGSGSQDRDKVELIYVTIGKNTLYENETQTITLDAKARYSVTDAKVILENPRGLFLEIGLDLTDGNGGYGTWQAEISSLSPGLYRIAYVDLEGLDEKSSKREEISDRSFYVLSENVLSDENLQLIYIVLEESEVSGAGDVAFRLDARDFEGVEEVTATIKKIKGEQEESFQVPLELVEGSKKYGTWEGFINVDEPDTTFSIVSVTLSNSKESKAYEIKNRSVYANLMVEDLEDNSTENFSGFLTGFFVINPEKVKQSPGFPAIIGFSSFIFIAVAYLLVYKVFESKPVIKG